MIKPLVFDFAQESFREIITFVFRDFNRVAHTSQTCTLPAYAILQKIRYSALKNRERMLNYSELEYLSIIEHRVAR